MGSGQSRRKTSVRGPDFAGSNATPADRFGRLVETLGAAPRHHAMATTDRRTLRASPPSDVRAGMRAAIELNGLFHDRQLFWARKHSVEEHFAPFLPRY